MSVGFAFTLLGMALGGGVGFLVGIAGSSPRTESLANAVVATFGAGLAFGAMGALVGAGAGALLGAVVG